MIFNDGMSRYADQIGHCRPAAIDIASRIVARSAVAPSDERTPTVQQTKATDIGLVFIAILLLD
jgi:hypothetical protein